MGGITTFYTSREDAILRPSKVSLSGYYATTGQYKFSLNPQLYFGRNKTIVSANIDYGHYVDKFWGIGPDTPDIEDAAAFESKGFGAEITLLVPPALKFFNRTSTGVVFDLYNSDIVDKRDNPELQSGDVRGSEGGVSTGLGFSWNWDTRDQVFYPTHGGYHQVKGIYYGQWLGGTFDFNKYEIDLRQYQQIKPQQSSPSRSSRRRSEARLPSTSSRRSGDSASCAATTRGGTETRASWRARSSTARTSTSASARSPSPALATWGRGWSTSRSGI